MLAYVAFNEHSKGAEVTNKALLCSAGYIKDTVNTLRPNELSIHTLKTSYANSCIVYEFLPCYGVHLLECNRDVMLHIWTNMET